MVAARSTILVCFVLTLSWMPGVQAQSDEYLAALERYQTGRYEECLVACDLGLKEYSWTERFWRLKIETQLELGQYPEAQTTLEASLRRFGSSIQLRWLGARVYRFNGEPKKAATLLTEMTNLVNNAPARYSDSVNRICMGRFMLARGADGRRILEEIYDRVKKDRPTYAGPYIASAELAIAKSDFGLAAQELERAVKLSPGDPYVHYLLARSYRESDPKRATAAAAAALKRNPRHIPTILLLADRLIDSEQYRQAESQLVQALSINIRHPLAWAYMAVLAHLQGDAETEKAWRQMALACHTTNPEVDYLIGKKLSQKYRFDVGRKYQLAALKNDPTFLPARMQLSQDLLRLGMEDEGWKLAEQVYEQDGYNVVAHNLVTLHENLARFRTIEADGFLIRMSAKEAAIYGDRVVELLTAARKTLVAKYDVKLREPTIVEIFPQQKDFAIRTFGLPGGAGFLGVCFGRVITANSPASQGGSPSNWRAVLWHEFCHVVTLQKTDNKMPRWLSEGISVYEEVEANPTWGQSMNARYREMILGGELTPVSDLSAAFLNPPSAIHLQFAYYESSLVVRFLVEKYGIETLKRILVDLSVGMPINESLRRYAGSLQQLDKEFEAYARSLATAFLKDANWDEFDLPPTASLAQIAAWNKEHPGNLAGLRREAAARIRQKDWGKAREILEQLVRIHPRDSGNASAWRLLAQIYRELGETAEEKRVLEKLASISNDTVDAYLRLLEVYSEEKKWSKVAENAERVLAVNPLIAAPYRRLAAAAESLQDVPRAVRAYRALVEIGPIDPAQTHFQLATLLRKQGRLKEAKRQVLRALEDAPRFRAAHGLLLEIVTSQRKTLLRDEKDSAKKDSAKKDSAKKDSAKKDSRPKKERSRKNNKSK